MFLNDKCRFLPDQNRQMNDFGACTDLVGIGPVLCIDITVYFFKKRGPITTFGDKILDYEVGNLV